MERSTICLAMLAHNEGEHFQRIYDILKNRVDAVVVLTNEDDVETKDAAHNIFTSWKVETKDIAWKDNWAEARNLLFHYALESDCDYILWLDPDTPLVGTIPLELDQGFYQITCRNAENNSSYIVTPIFRKDIAQAGEWFGAVHEFFTHATDEGAYLETCYLERKGAGADRTRILLIIDILKKEIKKLDDPIRPRNIFYLGQMYTALAMYQQAAVYYKMRLGLDDFEEEEYYSLFMLGELHRAMGKENESELWYLRAFAFRPTRREAYRALVRLHGQAGDLRRAHILFRYYCQIPPCNDILFVDDGPRSDDEIALNGGLL